MNRKTILVVDDNPDHLELTVTTLQEQSGEAEIVLARDGQAALDYLFGRRAHAGRDLRSQPAFVLLDLKLLNLSGLDVLRSMRAHPATALVPVVMLTSSSEPSDLLASYREGANAFVCKPVNFGDFTRKLQALKAFWLGVNEVAVAA
ncbi:MAG: response regulator [Polaromonas sp.]|nr:response regulator [Polaromonas sp.]